MNRLINDTDHLCRVLGIPFSPEQLDAITCPIDAPQVIVAGAGSGKTTVMAARVVWLVGHEGMPPGRVLGLTFTNKAAAELGARVREALTRLERDAGLQGLLDELGEPTVSTYNAFAGALIDEHGLRLGFETDLRITADASRFQRAARCVQRWREPLVHVSTSLGNVVQSVLSLDGSLNEHLVSTDELREHDRAVIAEILDAPKLIGDLRKGIEAAETRIELSRLVDAYREAKAADGVMDFSDQMSRGARLGIECPEVSQALRERFGVVLLDEYQDTSVAQRLMLQGLFSGTDPADGRGHPVTAVGDPTQSIYGWRGAAASNLQDFLEHFPTADDEIGRSYQLRTSRRSHADILDLANTIVQPYYDDNPVVSPLLPAAAEPRGLVSVVRFDRVSTEIDELADAVARVVDRTEHPEEVAILVRKRDEMAAITQALRARQVPVEVLGLDGLLSQPEIVEIVSVLEVLADASANPAMIRLLTNTLWRIGPRDLALLGRRARRLASGPRADDDTSLESELRRAVAGVDPTEIVSLCDAVEDPGDAAFSPQARVRLASLSALLSGLRRSVAEPLVDLIGMVVRRLGLDVEIALGVDGQLAGDNVSLLLDAAAQFSQSADSTSLTAFLAYLRAEHDFNGGMGVALPSDSRSVKLLTVHKAKGLEWDVVFVPFMAQGVFPSGTARERWTSNGSAFPVPLRGDVDSQPQLAGWSGPELKDLAAQFAADAAAEDLRLAYVAFTRARHELHLSGHWWGRDQVKPRGPSAYLDAAHRWALEHGQPVGTWADPPQPGPDGSLVNPHLEVAPVAWPPLPADVRTRHRTAEMVTALLDGVPVEGALDGSPQEHEALTRLAALDTEIDRLMAEAAARRDRVTVRLPEALSATAVMALAADEQAFTRDLARPMPRQPSPAARFGTRFHAWVETHFGQQSLLDLSDLPGRADTGIADEVELEQLTQAFADGPYGDTSPFVVEAPFSIVLGGQQVIGRIDAVYRTDEGFEVVDWKTNRQATADPLQLAIYRIAWAELQGVDPSAVTGAFYYVRLGEVRRFDDLPERAELEKQLRGRSDPLA